MTETTANSMNLLVQKGSARLNAKCPGEMKRLVVKASGMMNMSESQFIKMAVAEKLDKVFSK